MKRFFQLLLAGLFLMAVGFISEPKVMSIDDDVGTSISVDIQEFEIADQTQFVSSYQYQEVGIVPTESTNFVSLQEANYELYYETLTGNINLIHKQYASTYNEGKMDNLNASSNSYKTSIMTTYSIQGNNNCDRQGGLNYLGYYYVTQTINA